jgi:hypothetical protein
MRVVFATDCVFGCGMLVVGCRSGFCQMDAFLGRGLHRNSRDAAANQGGARKERGVYQKL